MAHMLPVFAMVSLIVTACQSPRPIPSTPKPTLTVLESKIRKKTPGPIAATAQLRQSVASVRDAVVAVELEGFASGVVISPNGYVLCAAHVAAKTHRYDVVGLVFENGTRVKAYALGYDASADIALFKIAEKGPWPHVTLAKKVPPAGSFCFTLAHPAGYRKTRPAQVRFGRINSVIENDGVPLIIHADATIQPGDSGGPLFDLDGLLIGIDSSAVSWPGFNRFGCIDQFHLSLPRMLSGDRFGDARIGPANTTLKGGDVDRETLKAMEAEVIRRWKINHQPTVEKVAGQITKDGLPPSLIIAALGKDAIPLMHGQTVVLGMDDPALIRQLPKTPKSAVRPIAIHGKDGRTVLGLPVSERHLLVKHSDFKTVREPTLVGQGTPVTVIANNDTWDLALVDCGKTATFTAVSLTDNTPAITPGQGLIGLGRNQAVCWGVATGKAYAVTDPGSKGPVPSPSWISARRSPYPRALPHDLPLFAGDTGTPVYTFKGEFVGVHSARLNRSTGLIITVSELKNLVRMLLIKNRPPMNPRTRVPYP